jgi:hypothetical protein
MTNYERRENKVINCLLKLHRNQLDPYRPISVAMAPNAYANKH